MKRVVKKSGDNDFSPKLNTYELMTRAYAEKRYDDIFKVIGYAEERDIDAVLELSCRDGKFDYVDRLREILLCKMMSCNTLFDEKSLRRQLDDKTFMYAISSGSKSIYDKIVSKLSPEYCDDKFLGDKICKSELIAYAAQSENFEVMKKFMKISPPKISELRKRNWKILHSTSESGGLNILKEFVMNFGVDRETPYMENNTKFLVIDYENEFVEVNGNKMTFNKALETQTVVVKDCYMVTGFGKLERGDKTVTNYINPVAAEMVYKKKWDMEQKFINERARKISPESEKLTKNDICANGHYYFHRLIARFDLEHLQYVLENFNVMKSDLILERDRDEIFPIVEENGNKIFPTIDFKVLFEKCDLMKIVDGHIESYGDHYEIVKKMFNDLRDGDFKKLCYDGK